MTISAGFPHQLLERSAEDRLDYFRNHTVAHAALKEADEAVMQAIEQPAGTSLVFVFGPTGVGKTTLLLHIQKKLIEASQKDRPEEKGHIPVAGMEAAASDSRNFDWKEYYRRALITLSEPLIGHKIDYSNRDARRNRIGHLVFNTKPATSELRLALEDALRYRRLRAFIVDEAQHLTRMASGRKLQDQLDCIKSLSNMTGTVHLLVGTYELLALRNLSGQLSRRSADVHFRRYRVDSATDAKAFQSVLWDFQRHLPVPQEPDFLRHWQYIYERTIGCVGVLKTWLMKSLADVIRVGAPTVTLQHLEKHALSISQCVSMSTEALKGEEAFSDTEESRDKLRDLLGIKTQSPVSSESAIGTRCSPKFVPHRVAQRKPYRDPIGIDAHVSQ
jgi:hypothetical protein